MKFYFGKHLPIFYSIILYSIFSLGAHAKVVWHITIHPEGAEGASLIIQYPITGDTAADVRVFEVTSRGLNEVTTYYDPKKILEFKRSGNEISLKFSSSDPEVAQKSFTEISFNPANPINNSFKQYGSYGELQGSRNFKTTALAKTDLMENSAREVRKGAGLFNGLTPPPAKLPKLRLEIRHLWRNGGDLFAEFHGEQGIYFKPFGSTEFHRIETGGQSGFNREGDHFETRVIKDKALLARLLGIPIAEISDDPGFLIDFRTHAIQIVKNVGLARNVNYGEKSILASAQELVDPDVIAMHQAEFKAPNGFKLASRTNNSKAAPKNKNCPLELVDEGPR